MRSIPTPLISILLAMMLSFAGSAVLADEHEPAGDPRTVLEAVVQTDGLQALAAAVLLVDESGTLSWSIAGDLARPDYNNILLAPDNGAFEALLGLAPGTLDGLSIDEIKTALPDILSGLGLGAAEVAAILLKHYIPVGMMDTSARGLLRDGVLWMTDGSGQTFAIGSEGIAVSGEATIQVDDIFVANGVIHGIDAVLVGDLLTP